ncbi:hypothetical protein N9D02_03780 [Emcibacteraceae bacterium]|nr:hypothetical protein [Emcibacteraceae bacterium]
MNHKPLTNLAISSALWLAMLPTISFSQETIALPKQQSQAQLFLNASSLTSVKPLVITYHPQQVTLDEDNIKILQEWLTKLKDAPVPIHIYSYATPPMARRDMTKNSATHFAMRKAFNRALEAKNAIEASGINSNLIAMHAVGHREDDPTDQLRVTLRQE